MGAGLVKAAYAAADAIGMREHAPMRVYLYMAVTALDSNPEPVFYGGRDALAAALAAPRDASGYRTTGKAVRSLVQRGLIAVAAKGAPGRHARYRLLDGRGKPLASPTSGTTSGSLANEERGPAVRGDCLPRSDSSNPEDRRNAGTPGSSVASSTREPQVPVSNQEQRNLTDQTQEPQVPEQRTLKFSLRRKEENKEEAPPTRTCNRHTTWDHAEPCAACRRDRVAAEAITAARRPATMSEAPPDCPSGQHQFGPISGYCARCEVRADRAEPSTVGRAA